MQGVGYLLRVKQLRPTQVYLVSFDATVRFKNRNVSLYMRVLVAGHEMKVCLCFGFFSTLWRWPFEVSYVCCCLAAPVTACYYLQAVCEPATAAVVCSAVVRQNKVTGFQPPSRRRCDLFQRAVGCYKRGCRLWARTVSTIASTPGIDFWY